MSDKNTDFMSFLNNVTASDEALKDSRKDMENKIRTVRNKDTLEEEPEPAAAPPPLGEDDGDYELAEDVLNDRAPAPPPPPAAPKPTGDADLSGGLGIQERGNAPGAPVSVSSLSAFLDSAAQNYESNKQEKIEIIKKKQAEAEEMDLPEEIVDTTPTVTSFTQGYVQMTESIEQLHQEFTPEQMAYINSEADKNKLVARPDLGIDFNQIQDPLSVSDNIQLNKEIEAEKRAEEERRIKEAEEEEARRLQEEEEKKKGIEEIDETPEEEAARIKRQRKLVRKSNKKIPKKYPKQYYDPSHVEIDDDDGKEYYYFSAENTLRKWNMLWVTKFISLKKLDSMTDNEKFDNIAKKQHEKAEKLNAMDPYEQYDRDKKILGIKVGIAAVLVAAISAHVMFNVVPSHRFEAAMAAMKNKQYTTAGQQFISLGGYNNSMVYSEYCKGKYKATEKSWDEAKTCFEHVLKYQSLFSDNIQDLIYDCDYQKALELYSNRDYENAKSIFRSIPKYSEASKYYYQCVYQIASDYYDEGDYFKAIDNFYEISGNKDNYQYEDSATRMKDIASQIYVDASTAYEMARYQEAIDNFNFLASYSYMDSKARIDQCNYKYASTLYDTGEYEKAAEFFSENPYYKDSHALAKECAYQNGNKTYNQSPVDSIAIYETIAGFKNTNDILSSDELVMYGRWNIVATDRIQTSPIEFSFYKNGLFMTQKSVQSVAISTVATPYSYQWNGNSFSLSANGTTYKIEIIETSEDGNKITIVCSDNNRHTYECERVMGYTEMLLADSTVNNEEESVDDSPEQKIRRAIRDYVECKMDGYITVNGEDIDVNSAKMQMQNILSQPENPDDEPALPDSIEDGVPNPEE